MKRKFKKAFTLVELLVVIAILAILATVSILGYSSFTKKAKKSNDDTLLSQLNMYVTVLQVEDTKISYFDIISSLNKDNIDVMDTTLVSQDDMYLVFNKDTYKFEILGVNDLTSNHIIARNTYAAFYNTTLYVENITFTYDANIPFIANFSTITVNSKDTPIDLYTYNSDITVTGNGVVNLYGNDNKVSKGTSDFKDNGSRNTVAKELSYKSMKIIADFVTSVNNNSASSTTLQLDSDTIYRWVDDNGDPIKLDSGADSKSIMIERSCTIKGGTNTILKGYQADSVTKNHGCFLIETYANSIVVIESISFENFGVYNTSGKTQDGKNAITYVIDMGVKTNPVNLTIKNCSFEGLAAGFIKVIKGDAEHVVTIDNCTFDSTISLYDDSNFIKIDPEYNYSPVINVTNCKYKKSINQIFINSTSQNTTVNESNNTNIGN